MKQVAKAIIHQEEEFLLQLRDNRPDIAYSNSWSFFGGQIEPGETPWQALQRELEEELEWHPQTGRFLWLLVIKSIPVFFIFSVEFTGNRENLRLHEGQDLKWFTAEKLGNYKKLRNDVIYQIKKFQECTF